MHRNPSRCLAAPLVATIVVAGLAAAAPGQGCPPIFVAQPQIDAGSNVNTIVAADFDRDGIMDLAITSSGDNRVLMLRGLGGGAFGPPQGWPVGTSPTGLLAIDLNKDGRVDLVAACLNSGSLSILAGTEGQPGTITFAAPTTMTVPASPFSIASGDLNDDGWPDLVVGHFGLSVVSVTLSVPGGGGGAFGTPTTYPSGQTPAAVAVADFNGDGKPDVLASNLSGNTISFHANNGVGGLLPRVSLACGTSPRSVHAADINSDGRMDAVTVNSGSGDASVLLGYGDGTFEPQLREPLGGAPQSGTLIDINNDGRPDVVAPVGQSSSLAVLVCNGNGSYGAPSNFGSVPSAQSCAAADLDGDGLADAAVLRQPGQISVLLNRTNVIRFSTTPRSEIIAAGLPITLTAQVTTTSVATIRWRMSGVDLPGATGPILTIAAASAANDGIYEAVASGPCGSVVSPPAYIAVQRCAADMNASGNVSVQDLFDFLAAYFAGCP